MRRGKELRGLNNPPVFQSQLGRGNSSEVQRQACTLSLAGEVLGSCQESLAPTLVPRTTPDHDLRFAFCLLSVECVRWRVGVGSIASHLVLPQMKRRCLGPQGPRKDEGSRKRLRSWQGRKHCRLHLLQQREASSLPEARGLAVWPH